MRAVFDLEILLAFVVTVDLKSLSGAANTLGRSTSAVSAQIKRLDDMIGFPVFRKQGRGLELTETGMAMLVYARRLLELNREALNAVRNTEIGGSCRVCLQQDFCDDLLPDVLSIFQINQPHIRIDVMVPNNSELHDICVSRSADLVVAWDTGNFGNNPYWTHRVPIQWIGPKDAQSISGRNNVISLVTMREECHFRSVATTSLDKQGCAWHVAFTSPSLSGVWAGVKAHLGVTARTLIGMPAYLKTLRPINTGGNLPELPDIGVSVFLPNGESPIARTLGLLFRKEIEGNTLERPSLRPVIPGPRSGARDP